MELSKIPTTKHPLSLKRYDRLRRELEGIQDALSVHGYGEIADDVLSSAQALKRAWDSIQVVERAERASRGELWPWEPGYAEQTAVQQ
jgi:hypothetical protein